jgi:hypothetical protein
MSYLSMPEFMPDPIAWLRRTKDVVNGLMQGKSNNVGTVTLTANTTTTTVTLAAGRLGTDTHISFTATTASAKTTDAAGISYSKDVPNNQFTITHDNTADVDKTFSYALIG